LQICDLRFATAQIWERFFLRWLDTIFWRTKDRMDRMDHDTMRLPDLIPALIEIIPGTSIIDEDDDLNVDHGEVFCSLAQEGLHITASNIRQMILDIRSSSPLAFINQCTHSLRTTNNLVANAGAIDSPASQGVNKWPTTSYDVTQPSAAFVRKVSQQNIINSRCARAQQSRRGSCQLIPMLPEATVKKVMLPAQAHISLFIPGRR
jgi:hypothetical protein